MIATRRRVARLGAATLAVAGGVLIAPATAHAAACPSTTSGVTVVVGGTVRCGPKPCGGWLVRASVPTPPEPGADAAWDAADEPAPGPDETVQPETMPDPTTEATR